MRSTYLLGRRCGLCYLAWHAQSSQPSSRRKGATEDVTGGFVGFATEPQICPACRPRPERRSGPEALADSYQLLMPCHSRVR